MKHIEAIIPHDLIQAVEMALIHCGIEGLTLTSVYAPGLSSPDLPGGTSFGTPCCKLDVLVGDEELRKVQEALAALLDSPLPVYVMDLEATIRIRTGECEEAALR